MKRFTLPAELVMPKVLTSWKSTVVILTLVLSSIFLFNIRSLDKTGFVWKLNVFKPTHIDVTRDVGRNAAKRPKLILFYTTLWNNKLWPGFETSKRFNNWGGIPCGERNCMVTYNKNLSKRADVVIFHAFGNDMVGVRELNRMSAHRNENQAWVYFMHECPHNAWPRPQGFDGFFNWTMSYRRDADIRVNYNWEWGAWERVSQWQPRERIKDYSYGKDKLVYGMISHCGVLREKYIRKLQEYIPVDIYGRCSKRFHQKAKVCPRNTKSCRDFRKRYKFFLAFENSFCVDYITEKFHETLMDGDAVPIVLGGADYKSIVIKGSYVNVLDFDSVEELANFLKFLDRNDRAYNAYQEWRRSYRLGQPKSWSCEICRMANEQTLQRKTYPDLGAWYAVENNCGTGVERLRSIMNNSNIPKPYNDEYYKY